MVNLRWGSYQGWYAAATLFTVALMALPCSVSSPCLFFSGFGGQGRVIVTEPLKGWAEGCWTWTSALVDITEWYISCLAFNAETNDGSIGWI